MIRVLKSAIAAIKDPERPLSERIFLILTFVSEITVVIALIGDVIIKESPLEMLILVSTLIVVPTIVLICLRLDKLQIAIRIIMIGLVVVILPSLFFFGGGVQGGGVLWIIFAFMYGGLVLHGRWRNVMFLLIMLLSLACFVISYLHPELLYPHTVKMFYADTFISLMLVGVLCFIMTWFQGRLFMEKSERAKKEAERAEELTRSQNRFFSSMSHEIRTPINSILGLNELILRDQTASDEIVRDASGIQGSGKMLLALINDILDFSKIEAGSMDIVPVDYRVGDMLSEIVNMLWIKANDKGLHFEVTVDPEVPMVLYGDEVRIKQILINLLNNAVKYTREGRVELRVESKGETEETMELWVSVSDTGMGIKKEDIPYLFDAFKRVDEGKNRHIEGTGLGLSIVKQLVELMDGDISVNSIYGEGTTFLVKLVQRVSDPTKIGELNIHNQQVVRRSVYESSFLAPEARILIVDDNEMNLEVESRLLMDTDMAIDKALSGKQAQEMCLKYHYDTIFMDHLMPGMDGIDCLKAIREQAGGLNRTTPVVVLTANAGAENRELYNKAGFDGYLVKPVSGESMEKTLIQHISSEKVIRRNTMMGVDEDIHASDKFAEKVPVIITASSMCDLPDAVIKKLRIPIIPFIIKTEEGVFKDGLQMDANELVRHMSLGKDAVSSPQGEEAYTEFFADVLKRAHNLIHISITTSMSREYGLACDAARSFDNVSVVNSECVSSATGILVLIACKLVQQGMQVQDILNELDKVKHRLRCSFVINTTEYMVRRGLISNRVHRIAEALNLHPAIRVRDNKRGVGGMWIGRMKRAYRKYIAKTLPPDTIPDADVVFITYADVPIETLNWIEETIRKTAYFEHVVFQQASAAITSNCGPGSLGILYFLKSNKSYNIGSFIEDLYGGEAEETEAASEEVQEEEAAAEAEEETSDDELEKAMAALKEFEDEFAASTEETPASEPKWYEAIPALDPEEAIKNSGSEEAFRSVLKIFYDSIEDRSAELEGCYSREDWKNYTIKIHALKSSARLVGAGELSKDAEALEMAGKEDNIAYIRENHAHAMEEYLLLKEAIAPLFKEDETEDGDGGSDKPVADEYLMEGIYEGLREAAQAMDCDMVEEILKEIEGYTIPDGERERFTRVKEKADMLDYDGIIEALDG